jgi:hypothetical protein
MTSLICFEIYWPLALQSKDFEKENQAVLILTNDVQILIFAFLPYFDLNK